MRHCAKCGQPIGGHAYLKSQRVCPVRPLSDKEMSARLERPYLGESVTVRDIHATSERIDGLAA